MNRRFRSATLVVALVGGALAFATPAAAAPTPLPETITGGGPGSGSEWHVSDWLGFTVDDATLDPGSTSPRGSQSDAYDGASIIKIDGTHVEANAGSTADIDGQYARVGPRSLSGLNVHMEYFALESAATLRNLTTLANPTASPITVTVEFDNNWGSDGSTTVQGTSSGDLTLTTADRWYVTSDSATDPSDPVNVTVFGGPGNPRVTPSTISDTTFSAAGTQGLLVGYEVTVPAGQTRRLMFFHEMTQTNQAGVTAAGAYDKNPATDSELIGDLSGGVLASIVNWDVQAAPVLPAAGYYLFGADSGVFAFGQAGFVGTAQVTAPSGALLNAAVVDGTASPSGQGYWMVASDGGIFSFGDARFHGSMGAVRLNQPITAIGSTGTGRGYWMVASDGGIFSFGDARYYGSMGATSLNQPIVGMGTSPG